MAFVIADRVRENSTTTGTGNITLGGAVTGYQTFDSALNTSDTTYYTIADQGGSNWEVGIGTFTAPATLARTTILSSSNGGSIVNFTAGTKDVFISLPASKTNTNDQPNVISVNSTSDALRITQTGTGNALVVEDSANPDATPLVVNAAGQLLVGTTTNVSSTTGIQVAQAGNNVTSPVIDFTKERAGTPVLNGQVLGITRYWGYDGANYLQAGSIELSVSNTPSTGLMPTALAFRTRSETAAAETTRVVINSNGNVVIANNSGDGPALSTTNPAKLRLGAGQYTDNSTAASGTVNFGTLTSIVGATVNALNTGVTYTTLPTVYINAAPTAGTNVTITNPYAFYVATGASYFGGQLQTAAGTAAAPAISTIGDTNNGIFFPAADTIAFSTAGSERMRINSTGLVGIGTSSLSNQRLRVQYNVSDATATSGSVLADGTHTLTATNAFQYNNMESQAVLNQGAFNQTTSLASGGGVRGFRAFPTVSGASGTVTAAVGYAADVRNTGAGVLTNGVGFVAQAPQNTGGGTLTNAMGFYAAPMTNGANNFGFYSDLASGTGLWNFYANGTAANYFAGQVQLGAGSAAAPALSAFGDTNTGMFFPAADTMAFAEGGTEVMRIDSSGNVGIGTTSPDATRALTLNRAGNYGGIELQVNGSTQARIQQEATGSLYIDSGITTTTGSTIFRTANGSERMRIDSSGNVGIGTSAPSYKLEVRATAGGVGAVVAGANAGGNAQINVNSTFSSTSPVYGFFFNGTTGIGNPAANVISAITAGTETMRIDSSGNVGIGTSSPASKLDVNGAIRDSKGDVRTIVQNAQTGAYVLVVGDAGKHISITTGGVTVNSGIFSAGDAISIYNNSAANQTITQGASVTMYLGGTATTGNRTLAQRGICTILCVAANTFVISGAGLT